jgi:hypothetical protein
MPPVNRFIRAIAPALVLFFVLVNAADAGPAWRELGDYKDSPLPPPGFKKGCEGSTTTTPPKPATCKAIAHLTGYQTRFGPHKNPYQVNNRGKITAVTVRLGNPTKDQLKFFNQGFGPPTIRLSVLKKPKPDTKHHTDLRLVDQSEAIDVSKYLGSTPTFVLSRPLVVPGGPPATIAITVPTWAPVFTINRPKSETWRASTPSKHCGDATVQSAHQTVGSVKFYDCSFKEARLLYHATFLRDPKQTKK